MKTRFPATKINKLWINLIPKLCSLQINLIFRGGIWIPDLFFENEKNAAFHQVVTESKLSEKLIKVAHY